MRTAFALKTLFVAIALASATQADEASAANRFGLTEIINDTNVTLNYSIRWGPNGQWQNMQLAPGKSWIHSWRYERVNNEQSPTLYVRFDEDLDSNLNNFRTGTCVRYAAPEISSRFSKKYKFVRDGYTGRFIDLVGIN